MSGLAARTGRQFFSFKYPYMIHNLRHASNIQRFHNIFSRKGQGSNVVTHQTPYIMNRTFASKQDLKDLKESDKDVADLEKIVEERAWLWYAKQSGFQNPLFKKRVDLKLDWSNVKFIPDLPKYDKITHDTTESLYGKVTFAVGKHKNEIQQKDITDEVLYYNGTSTEQMHQIRTERKAASSYQATMDKGYTNSKQFKLTMAAPQEIVKVASEFSEGLSVTKGVKDSEEQIITRVTEEHIRVPSKSGIKVVTLANQKEDGFRFQTLVTVEGSVEATFSDMKGNKLALYYLDTQIVICEEIPEAVEDGDKYKINYTGTCNFTYGMLQRIALSEFSEDDWLSTENTKTFLIS